VQPEDFSWHEGKSPLEATFFTSDEKFTRYRQLTKRRRARINPDKFRQNEQVAAMVLQHRFVIPVRCVRLLRHFPLARRVTRLFAYARARQKP
jgi:hypothetical protein